MKVRLWYLMRAMRTVEVFEGDTVETVLDRAGFEIPPFRFVVLISPDQTTTYRVSLETPVEDGNIVQLVPRAA